MKFIVKSIEIRYFLHYYVFFIFFEVDFVIEESFGQGKAYELKWNKSAFKLNKYKKFTENYANFPLECLSAEDFYRF